MAFRIVVIGAMLAMAPSAHASLCNRYAMLVEDNSLVSTADITRWGQYALKAEGLYSEAPGACRIYVNVTVVHDERASASAVNVHIQERQHVTLGDSVHIVIGAETGQVFLFGDQHAADVKLQVRSTLEAFISEKIKATERLDLSTCQPASPRVPPR